MLQVQWLMDLETEITDEDREFDFQIEEGDEEVGEVPEGLQPLFHIRSVLFRKFNAAIEQHKLVCKGAGGPDCDEFNRESTNLRELLYLTEKLFWTSLRMHVGVPSKAIGLRKDWKVVACVDKQPKMEPFAISAALATLMQDADGGGMIVLSIGNEEPPP